MGSGWWSSISAVYFGILFFLGSCRSEKAPYSTFARDATLAPSVVHFDYIIIGGGTAGCALATTLSEGATVLVLERGGLPYGNHNITNMGSFAATLSDTSPSSPSQPFISEDGVLSHRPRVLGGGSALNAGYYTRASTAYVKSAKWNQKLVNESYVWIEKKLTFKPKVLQWQSTLRDGLLEAGVSPFNGFTYDHLYGTKVGGTIFDQDGHRHTAADLFEYADATRVSVYLYATVHRVLFRTKGQAIPRAHAVVFRDAKGNKHTAILKKGSTNEIILSAGAIGSPQLLMLSGVGPKEHLQARGIRVVLDQPMIGQGMADNPMNGFLIPSPRPVEISLVQVVGITHFGSFVEAASGVDFQQFWNYLADKTPLNQTSQLSTWSQKQRTAEGMVETETRTNSTFQAGIIVEKIIGPHSTGHLELQNRDAKDNPKVTFNYFKDPRDLQRCVEGLRTVIKVIESRSFSKFRYPDMPVQHLIDKMLTLPMNLRPRHDNARFSLEQYCIDTVMTIWHYHGGCQVGKVVDHDYKVLGVDALRVVDGSTFTDSPGTNPQATVMMLGRYVGQRILRERFPHGATRRIRISSFQFQ